MDLALVFKAVFALCAIGALSVALLATAAQKFVVEVDPRVQHLLEVMPGANCGACGNPSCFAAAEAVVEGRAKATVCVAGGKGVAEQIAEIMGESCEFVPLVSARHCGGGVNARRAFAYEGLASCATVSKMAGGSIVCPFGCLGFGDCVRACPFDALAIDARGLAVVDVEKCTGCGICVRECPRGGSRLLALESDVAPVCVRCSSKDPVKDRRSYCSKSCIACKKCERACPTAAIAVIDGIAVLDPAKCISCYSCVDVCPQDCIDVHGRSAPAPFSTTDGASRAFAGFAVDAAAAATSGTATEEGAGA